MAATLVLIDTAAVNSRNPTNCGIVRERKILYQQTDVKKQIKFLSYQPITVCKQDIMDAYIMQNYMG